MKKTAILFLLIISSRLVFSQIKEPEVKFGTYNLADVQMKVYDKDSTAEAVVLYDSGDYSFSFENDLHLVYTFHKRIKILKKSALERATVIIPYYSDSSPERQEFVRDIQGYTYNMDGNTVTMTELTKASIFNEKSSTNYRETKIIFPQVKEGSVIDLTYKIISPLWYSLRTWNFQQDIPVVWSGIKTLIPGYFDFKITYFGYNAFAIKDIKQGTAVFFPRVNERGETIKDPYLSYHFAMKDLPSIKEDEFMTTVNDYRSSIDFELARTFFPTGGERNYSITYNDLTKTLLDYNDFGGALKKFGKTARKISAEIKTNATNKDTLTLISDAYEHIRNNIQWNGENRLYATQKLDQVYEKKSGNSAEINLMLVAVLQELGFDANPVVLSTRAHGKVLPDIALIDRFNYTIAQLKVNGKDFLLDATDKFVKMNMLPKRCLNQMGWLIGKNPRWVSLIPSQKSMSMSLLTFSIEEDQKLKGNFSELYYGYAGTEKKLEISKEGEEKYLNKLKEKYTLFENPEFKYKVTENKDVSIECETTVNEAYSVIGDRIFIKPLFWKTQQTNPFKQDERKYPVDFGYTIQETVISKITIPKGYSVESMPLFINVFMPDSKGKYQYIIKSENGVIEVMSQLSFARTIFSAEDYSYLRELFVKMIAKQNEQIVLKKN